MGKRARARRRAGQQPPRAPRPDNTGSRHRSSATPSASAAVRALAAALPALWERGWQPTDVIRFATRDQGADAGRVVAAAVVVDARSLPSGGPIHPEWAAQVEAARTRLKGWTGDPLDDATVEALTRMPAAGVQRISDEMLRFASVLPPLPTLIPPPSGWRDDPVTRLEWARQSGAASDIDEGILGKIRALLAKAESTTFPEEAEALTAKAQELITRHAVDDVLLSAGRGDGDPIGRRIPLDDPYADTKFLLLAAIADANRCRAIYMTDLATATTFGYPADLRAVELLFTSLLVQATTAMVAAGAHAEAGAPTRQRGFRRAFLASYATRIGHRLREAATATESAVDATHGGDLLPVLATRSDAVDAAVEAAFPRLTSMGGRRYDARGWHAGAEAADRATLGGHGEVHDGARGALGSGR